MTKNWKSKWWCRWIISRKSGHQVPGKGCNAEAKKEFQQHCYFLVVRRIDCKQSTIRAFEPVPLPTGPMFTMTSTMMTSSRVNIVHVEPENFIERVEREQCPKYCTWTKYMLNSSYTQSQTTLILFYKGHREILLYIVDSKMFQEKDFAWP